MCTADRIRIFLCEDDERFRRSLAKLLAAAEDFEVCGQAATAEETLALLAEEHYDILLLDLELPDRHGLEVLARIQTLAHPPDVLVLTSFADEDLVFRAMRLGAAGYLVKARAATRLLRAVRDVVRGGVVLDPRLARRFWNLFQANRTTRPAIEGRPELTDREREILQLLAKGLTNPELGEVLGLSRRTVKRELEELYRKLQVSGRVEAVVQASRLGLVDL